MIEFTYDDQDYLYQLVGSYVVVVFTMTQKPSLVTDEDVIEAAREHLRLQEEK